LERALDAAKTAERLHELRYRAGAESLQVLLTAQDTRRAADLALSANQLSRLQNYVTLCLALGGRTSNDPPFR
jgi:outer membrane protein TolC